MERINPNDPSFPTLEAGQLPDNTVYLAPDKPGMSIRTQLAAMAMQGLLSRTQSDGNSYNPVWLAEVSVDYADALIEELNKNADVKKD